MRRGEQLAQVELERAPRPLEQARVHLADEARGRAGRLAGMEQRALGALERRLGLERRVQRLDHALRAQEAALGDARDADALVGQLAAGEVDARDLEQRDPPRARVDVALARPRRGSGSASSAARSARPRSARAASTSCRRRAAGSACTSRRSRGRRARPRRGGAAPARGVSRPNISRRAGSVFGTSSSRKRAISSIASTSRVTSRARQVGTTTSSPSRSKPSLPSRRYWRSGGVSMPISASARSGR